MTSVELYSKRARVWIPDPESVWVAATIEQDYKEGDKSLKLLVDDADNVDLEETEDAGQEKDYPLKDGQLPPLCNPDVLIGENDLTSLSYLHEPAVLHNLQIRFVERNQIYTYCGIVLVAINPYEDLSIYSNDFIHLYSGHNIGEMDPHIFAIAEEAFKQMTRAYAKKNKPTLRENRNQSIIVTGESGAGKTVSAKYAMRYFATVGGSTLESQVEKKVLASNPIMEAIGNAKTTRNDNSSRFGKYIQISFSKQFHIIGAHMRTYLLEKSRVVSQAPEERNYHIFYQLCACADLPQFKPLKLLPAENFEYTRIGDCTTIDGVDDQKEFQETVHALTLLGVSTKYQSLMFRILSAILHMGNVEFVEDEKNDSCRVSEEDPHLLTMCELLGIETKQMAQWFCNRKITTMAEVLIKPLTTDQAVGSRDALAKHIYSKLFEWIVEKINRALINQEKEHSFIGVLDIYGFETFEINSFEQFCINYANEKLQQQFCQHVFKLEQEEYVREKIDWKFIDFTDNQPCIDLIEKKLGILDLLDDECRMPKGSDIAWAQKLYDKHLKTSKHFEKPRTSTTSFIVIHFADKVRYEVEGFLEKNRDTVHEEQLNILKASQKFELVAELFVEKDEENKEVKAGVGKHGPKMVKSASIGGVKGGRGGRKEMRKTVGNQFQGSLGKLMTILNSTTPHYVRCIKPNDYKQAFTFEPKRAVQQLRACGVLETIRISAAGYPSRWSYNEFHDRYRVLMRSKEIVRTKPRVTCENVLARLIPEPDKYQPGKTKIFFRAGQVAYLEKLRADKLRACAIMVQKHIRGWLCKKQYLRQRNAAVILQRYARGMKARRRANFLRRTKAATVIQRRWRGYVAKSQYHTVRNSIICIQSYTRGMLARTLYRQMLRNAKATIIQAYVRGWLARIHYRRQLKAIVYLQCCVRRMYAKRELKALKIEARSIGHFKKLNQGMENKIVELQRKLDASNKETKSMLAKAVEAETLRQKVQKLEVIEQEAKVASVQAKTLEEEVAELRRKLAESQEETKIAKDELEKEKMDKDEIVSELKNERDHMHEELKELQEALEEQKLQSEKQLEESLASAKAGLQEELEKERSSHQARIKDYNRLEQRYDNLKDELELTRNQRLNVDSEPVSNGSSAPPSPPESAYNSINTNASDTLEVLQNGTAANQNVNLLAMMQKKVKALETEKKLLEEKVLEKVQEQTEEEEKRKIEEEEREAESEKQKTEAYAESFQLKEVLCEKEKLQKELSSLRESVADSASLALGKDSAAFKEMYNQMSAMQEELEVRRSESIELKSNVAMLRDALAKYKKEKVALKSQGTMTSTELLGSRNRMEDINLEKLEKSDLKTVLVKVYDHNRMLEAELEAERKNHDLEMTQMEGRMNYLNKGSNMKYLQNGDSIEGNVQLELARLSSENLELLAQIESLEKQNRKLKRQLKLYNKKLNTYELEMGGSGIRPSESTMSLSVPAGKVNGEDTQSLRGHPAVKHKDSAISGMLQYRKGDEAKAVKALILDLKPRSVAVSLVPGLPSYLLFMLLRFADYSNDDNMIKTLLSQIINGIKKVEKKHEGEFEYVSFWLANTCRFLHNMKQYSGDEEYMKDNSPTQQEHCLRNFDLTEYRQVFSDMAVSLYQKLVLLIMHEIKPMIVPAMLEHDTIQGLSSSVKPSGMRGRSSSRTGEAPDIVFSVETIIKKLDAYHIIMNQHRMDRALIQQIFKQVMYGITAHTINNQLLRKELCNWSKAVQIRYNVSQLEDWLRKNNLSDCGIRETLEPLVQASQLLQVKKQTEQDAVEICEMCTMLTPGQIAKLLNMITPTNDYEERVPVKFIKSVQSKLRGRRPEDFGTGHPLLMDNGFMYGVTFPYSPSTMALDAMSIPDSLNLSFLKLV